MFISIKAVTGNPVIYPPVIGTSQRAGEAEATAAELKVAADAAVAGRCKHSLYKHRFLSYTCMLTCAVRSNIVFFLCVSPCIPKGEEADRTFATLVGG